MSLSTLYEEWWKYSIFPSWWLYADGLVHRAYIDISKAENDQETTLCGQIFRVSRTRESETQNPSRCQNCRRLDNMRELVE